jgi:DNA-binding transcriptional MerR regulator/methylmalonyl-CoA mutase cobalamin-binding subunit
MTLRSLDMPSPNLLSIGALSRATGVPADTLRTWERRYGFPAAERTESGHRRYSLPTLERLRLVVRALDLGHRPGNVLTATSEQLASLLEIAPRQPARAIEPAPADVHEVIDAWIGHVERYEGRALDRELRTAYAELGGNAFLEERVGPFIVAIGERWAAGAITVGHEHFASERIRELLAELWRPLSDAATGAAYVCAAPPGELHVLGLHMVALTVALANGRVIFLGADTPVLEVAAAVAAHSAEAVIMSASASCEASRLAQHLTELRDAVPAQVPIVAGGAGVQGLFSDRDPAGVLVLQRFAGLRAWLRS